MRRPWGRLILTLAVAQVLAACANPGPPLPPSLELPKPPSDLRASRKGNKVLLSWTRPALTTDHQSVRGPLRVRICRTLKPEMSQCGAPVGQFTGGAILAVPSPPLQRSGAGRISDSYTDVLPREIISPQAPPASFVTYAVEAVNDNGRSAGLSNRVHVPSIETLPAPTDFAAKVSDQGVALTWNGMSAPHQSENIHYIYRVYRREEERQQQLLVGEVPAGAEGSLTLTDSNIEWERNYYYHAEAVSVTGRPSQPELQVDGDDSAEVKVFAHDVFPPSVPSGLQAAFSGPGQAAFIDLIWAPVTEGDLAGYVIYRHEGNAAPVRVNAELVKTPAYRDAAVGAGKTYFYSVSSVDIRGNESGRSEEASESVP